MDQNLSWEKNEEERTTNMLSWQKAEASWSALDLKDA